MNFYSMYNSLSTTHTGTAVGLFNDFSNSGGVEFGLYNRYNSVEGVTGLQRIFGHHYWNGAVCRSWEQTLVLETYAGTVYGMNNILFAEGNGVRYKVYNTLCWEGTGNKLRSYNPSVRQRAVFIMAFIAVRKATVMQAILLILNWSDHWSLFDVTSDGTAGQVMTTDDPTAVSAPSVLVAPLMKPYDYGGPRCGRTINAEDGAVFINRNTDAAGSIGNFTQLYFTPLSQRSAIGTYNAYPDWKPITIYRTGGPPFGEGF